MRVLRVHFKLYTSHFELYTPHSTLDALHLHCALYTSRFALWTLHFSPHTVHVAFPAEDTKWIKMGCSHGLQHVWGFLLYVFRPLCQSHTCEHLCSWVASCFDDRLYWVTSGSPAGEMGQFANGIESNTLKLQNTWQWVGLSVLQVGSAIACEKLGTEWSEWNFGRIRRLSG